MFIGSQLIQFSHQCSEIDHEEDLRALLAEITQQMGFEQFALNHHVDLVGPPQDAIVVMNYDPAWVEHALSRGYHLDDPVHAASTKAAFGFLWRDVPTLVRLSRRQRLILEEARGFGLREGFTVPVHMPGEYRGTCSFGARNIKIHRSLMLCAQMVGLCAFECARRIVQGRSAAVTEPVPELRPRQLDCLPFVASGKSDWAIAQILGLSPATVHQHVNTAMRRYGVSTRIQLIVRALFDSRIVYNAAFRS